MKSKFLKVLVTSVMVVSMLGLTACGSKDSEGSGSKTPDSTVENTQNDATSDSKDTSAEPDNTNKEEMSEAEKTPVISAVKEEEAVVDFDGVKLPITITWEEFKQFMADNNWTFEDAEKEFPGYKDRLYGGGFINTNCGKVYFNFQENEDNTQSVLMDVTVYSAYCPETISISGINIKTTAEKLSNTLTPVENAPNRFYLDDYLTVQVDDSGLYISRTFFNLR